MLADSSTASVLIERVWVEYGEGCSEKDIHGVRKTGLFYSMVPDGTCKFKCVDKYFFILKSHQTCWFINFRKLPVEYATNNEAWISFRIFQQCVNRETSQGELSKFLFVFHFMFNVYVISMHLQSVANVISIYLCFNKLQYRFILLGNSCVVFSFTVVTSTCLIP